MKECFTKEGMKLYVCMHNQCEIVNNRMGRPAYGVIHCKRKVFGLKRAFQNMTKNCTLTLAKLREATENKIDDASLLKSANLALELDFDPNLLPELFDSAMILGYSLGLDSTKSIESLVTGIARKSRLMLDNIGIVFLAEQAYRWYQTENKINECLTQEQKDKAWKEYAIKEVIQKAKKVRNGENQ